MTIRRWRRRVAVVSGLMAGLLISACMVLPDFVGQAKAGKYEPAAVDAAPTGTALMPTPRVQTEPHTCGLHALQSLYAAYGLDPDTHRLRFRLGTDAPALRVDKTTAGTLHPDLYRVLAQDGFLVTPLDLGDAAAADRLAEHLDAGHLAMTVVYRGTYHWMVLAPSEQAGVLTVVDSLAGEPSDVAMESFMPDALSITLVEPAGSHRTMDSAEAHRVGLAEMTSTYQRQGTGE